MNDPLDALPNYLPGQTPMHGIKQEADQYYQGSDIAIKTDLIDNGQVALFDDYNLKVVLKSDLTNEIPVWRGFANYGLFKQDSQTLIKIPKHITSCIPSGTYYLTIIGVPKADTSHLTTLFNKTISISPSAASTRPTVLGTPVVVIQLPDNGTSTIIVPIDYF